MILPLRSISDGLLPRGIRYAWALAKRGKVGPELNVETRREPL